VVSAFISTAFPQPDHSGAKTQWRIAADQMRGKPRRPATLIDGAEKDILAHMTVLHQHRTTLHSTNPIKRQNWEIKRRADVAGIFTNEVSIRRLVGIQHRHALTGLADVSTESRGHQFVAWRPIARPSLSQPAETNPSGGVTKADIRLMPAPKMFRQTEPSLSALKGTAAIAGRGLAHQAGGSLWTLWLRSSPN